MSSGKDSGREGEKTKQGYFVKQYWIHGDLSLDTLPSIVGYFFGAVFRSLFLITLNLEKTVRILAAPNVRNLHPRGGQER